jgi:dynein heavy chain, axonemal
MLEILSETKDPTRVQPHLKKCFEGIAELTFTDDLAITHMLSIQGEAVPFKSPVDTNHAHGSVEKWLLNVEGSMFESIHHVIAEGIKGYAAMDRHKWVLQWPGMVVLVVSALFWTEGSTAALVDGTAKAYSDKCTCACHLHPLFCVDHTVLLCCV